MLRSLIISLLFFPSLSHAISAEMILTPTRLVLQDGQRYATLSVKNSGDGIGRYRVEMVDVEMQETGALKVLPKETKDDFTAQDMLRISPRSFMLKPDEFQTLRLLVKKPDDLADGEYRSHLQVRMTATNVNERTGEQVKEPGISIKPRLVMVIPVLVENGAMKRNVTIENAVIKKPDTSYPKPRLTLTFGLSGNASVIGDITVTHTDAQSTRHILKEYAGIAVYRGTDKRTIDIPLDAMPPAGGTINITYHSQSNKDAPPVLARYTMRR